MVLNPWIDYLKSPELDKYLKEAGYDPNERITPRAVCCDPVYSRLAFIIVKSGEVLWHPQNLIADLSVVLEYWKAHSTDSIKSDLNDWGSQLRGRTAEIGGREIVHLYTSSGNLNLVNLGVDLLLDKGRIGRQAVILNEYGLVL